MLSLLSDTKLNIMHHCKHLKNIFLTIGMYLTLQPRDGGRKISIQTN